MGAGASWLAGLSPIACPICEWLPGDGNHLHLHSQVPSRWDASAFNAQFPDEFTRLYLAAPCGVCGEAARKHPMGGPLGFHGHCFLRRLCDGSFIKL